MKSWMGRARTEVSDPAYELTPRGKTLLQERLATYGATVFLIAISYWPAFYFVWRRQLGDETVLAHVLSPWSFALLLLHGALWLSCRTWTLPQSSLPAIDVAYHAAVGVVFGRIVLRHPSPVIALLEGLLALTSVLAVRALLVPSSGTRTALAGSLTCLGPGLVLFTNPEHFSSPWLGLRTSGALFVNWALVAIVISSVASLVLYGLRREVQDARRLGQYTLKERLGEGGMGIVYRAEHALLRRPTAVKLLPLTHRSDSVSRFEREVQLMAELTHPNTVAIYDYGRTADGIFYYAMEYLDGIDLEGLVEVEGPVPPARVIHILRQICGSLDEAHQRGLIHRDIKPANVFLCRKRSEPDVIKVLDFGLAKDMTGGDATLTIANAVLGTPLYMAPEAFAQPESVDTRSDVYSLGALAYLLVTGTPVFTGGTVVEVCAKHLHETPESLAARLGRPVPPDLDSIVLACLMKAPDGRPDSVLALRDALDACADAGKWSAADAADWWDRRGSELEARRQRQAGSGASASRTVLINPSRAEALALR